MAAEKDRYKQEMDFQLKMMELENQRRSEEREHELRLFSLLAGNNMQIRNVSPPPPHRFVHQEHFGGFSYNPNPLQCQMNVQESSSDTSSSSGVDDNLRTYYAL